jgi:hypothetical protein
VLEAVGLFDPKPPKMTQMMGTTPNRKTVRQPKRLNRRKTPEARKTPTGQPPWTIE